MAATATATTGAGSAVGRTVTVETATGTVVTGRVYACDLVSNTLVLERPAATVPPAAAATGPPALRDFDIFKIQHLVSVLPAVAVDDAHDASHSTTTPGHVDVAAIMASERARHEEAARALDRVGVNVRPEAQACFNLLAKTYVHDSPPRHDGQCAHVVAGCAPCGQGDGALGRCQPAMLVVGIDHRRAGGRCDRRSTLHG